VPEEESGESPSAMRRNLRPPSERTFRLSASIDTNKIKATYNLGVLTITLPKAETAKPHLIEVEVTPRRRRC